MWSYSEIIDYDLSNYGGKLDDNVKKRQMRSTFNWREKSNGCEWDGDSGMLRAVGNSFLFWHGKT